MSITLLNAGRGAGKTYTLVQWAKEDPKRFVVGSVHTQEAMNEAGMSNQYLSYVAARSRLTSFEGDVAFDDFENYLETVLIRDFGLTKKSVILATNLLEHEKKQDWTDLAWKLRSSSGFLTAADEYLDRAVKALDEQGLFSTVFGVKKEATKEEPKKPGDDGFTWAGRREEAKDEPKTQDIKARFLWLGARLADGTGSITSLRYDDSVAYPEKQHIVAEVKGSVFEGKLRLGVNDAVTVFKP